MTRFHWRGAARLFTSLVVVSLTVGGTAAMAGTALADEGAPANGGVGAVLKGHSDVVGPVHIERWGKRDAGLFNLETANGDLLKTYCVDFPTSPISGSKYSEVDWGNTSLGENADAGKIKWILDHAFPTLSAADLKKAAGIDGELTDRDAAAGTQLAIWHFSDKLKSEAKAPAAQAVSDYLVKNAKVLPEPPASLRLNAAQLAGKSGDTLGPIKVDTSSPTADVALDEAAKAKKVAVVNKAGRPVATAKNGDELYLTAPRSQDAIEATVTVTASSARTHGRAFKGVRPGGGPSQTMILAGTKSLALNAKVSAKWESRGHNGAIPTVGFKENCAKGGVEVTAGNKGDLPFDFTLNGKTHTVEPGGDKTILIKADKDQRYNITVTGDHGFKKSASGVLDCGPKPAPSPSSSDTPAPAPAEGENHDGDLATTGASGNAPLIGGIAAVLVLLGGATVFFLRKRGKTSGN
ncbi:TQXA domain-containing protein [Streptomyces celluloflavus]|uniref:TQXA domain-containing protein n=1 Tax=Streptomyces celluloflavus TaxID=58344 RepID=UPI0036A3CDA7